MAALSIIATADTYLLSGTHADDNYGGDAALFIGHAFTAAVDTYYRGVLRFPLASIPHNVTLGFVGIRIHSKDDGIIPVSTTFTAYRLNQPLWSELQATWNNYATATPWTLAGGDFLDDGTSDTAIVADGTVDMQFNDIGPMLQAALNLGLPFLDVLIKGPEVPGSATALFDGDSREAVSDSLPVLQVLFDYNFTDSALAMATLRPALSGRVRVNP